jgi:hypothetical protein
MVRIKIWLLAHILCWFHDDLLIAILARYDRDLAEFYSLVAVFLSPRRLRSAAPE